MCNQDIECLLYTKKGRREAKLRQGNRWSIRARLLLFGKGPSNPQWCWLCDWMRFISLRDVCLCYFANYLIYQKSLHKVMQVRILYTLPQWRVYILHCIYIHKVPGYMHVCVCMSYICVIYIIYI